MSDVVPPDEQFYSTAKVAELFSVTPETVREWIKNGSLEAIRVNSYWRVRRSSVLAFANSKYGVK